MLSMQNYIFFPHDICRFVAFSFSLIKVPIIEFVLNDNNKITEQLAIFAEHLSSARVILNKICVV